jgi:hypothetical protein
MNTMVVNKQPRIEKKSDNKESYPVQGYEVMLLNWLEQIRSSSSADELIELEEIN